MDDALRKRLDAIVALLAAIALLLVGIVAAVGGPQFLATLVLVGGVFCFVALSVYAEWRERETDAADSSKRTPPRWLTRTPARIASTPRVAGALRTPTC